MIWQNNNVVISLGSVNRMRTKKWVTVALGTTMAISFWFQSPAISKASSNQDIEIEIEGKPYPFKNAPIIKNGRTYIPIREVTESLGADVWWNGNSNTVGIEKEGSEVAFVIGSSVARVNGIQMKIDPSFIEDGVTRVPVRFLSEALGFNVKWSDQTRTITISKNETQIYTVKNGDTLFSVAQKLDTSVKQLKAINQLTSDSILVGQQLLAGQPTMIGNNTIINSNSKIPSNTDSRITYKTHTVRQGDTLWNLGIEYSVPMLELIKLNGLSLDSQLEVGQNVLIPVHNIPVLDTVSDKHGEYLDWWTGAQYVFSIGKVATVTDFATGKTFQVKRTIGANHADSEPLTAKDTEIAKQLWGGYSWDTRAVIVEVDGRRLAGSMSFMPHDIEYITDNNFNGHFDIYFKNSTRHKDGKMDYKHQAKVEIAAGVQ